MNASGATKTIAVLNRKGGVGKTTLSIAISEALVSFGIGSVLLVDLDPQSSASEVMMPKSDLAEWASEKKTFPSLLDKASKSKLNRDQVMEHVRAMVHLNVDKSDIRLDLLPNSHELWDLEYSIKGSDGVEAFTGAVNQVFSVLFAEYDFVVIDCPPGRTISSDVAIAEADLVLTPFNYDALSEWGMGRMEKLFQSQYGEKEWRFVANRVPARPSAADKDRIVERFKKHVFAEKARRGSADLNLIEIPEDKNFRERLIRLHDERWNRKRFAKLDKLYGKKASAALSKLTTNLLRLLETEDSSK